MTLPLSNRDTVHCVGVYHNIIDVFLNQDIGHEIGRNRIGTVLGPHWVRIRTVLGPY